MSQVSIFILVLTRLPDLKESLCQNDGEDAGWALMKSEEMEQKMVNVMTRGAIGYKQEKAYFEVQFQ